MNLKKKLSWQIIHTENDLFLEKLECINWNHSLLVESHLHVTNANSNWNFICWHCENISTQTQQICSHKQWQCNQYHFLIIVQSFHRNAFFDIWRGWHREHLTTGLCRGNSPGREGLASYTTLATGTTFLGSRKRRNLKLGRSQTGSFMDSQKLAWCVLRVFNHNRCFKALLI